LVYTSGRVSILIRVRVLYALAEVQYVTSSEVIVSRTKKTLTDGSKFWKGRHSPYQEGLLLLARIND
jgi:hypothetical protein